MVLIIVTILALFAQLLLTLVVLLKDPTATNNRAFSLLSVALMLWAGFNFAYDTFPEVARTIDVVRFIMFFVVLQNFFFVVFTRSLYKPLHHFTKKAIAYIALTVAAGGLALSPLIFLELAPTTDGNVYPIVQPGMAVFVVHAIVSILLGFKFLLGALGSSKNTQRQQLIYIVSGSVVLWGIVPITNFVLSLALQTSFFANLSPLYAFAFSALIAYAIIRHKLFDIRLAIARTVTYLLLLATLIMLYALAVFGTFALVFGGETQVGLEQNAVYVLAAVFLAFTFGPLKNFFNRLTNRVFFQDAYETKAVLDHMTTVLVRAVSLRKLADASLGILRVALKSSHISMVIIDPASGNQQKIMSIGKGRDVSQMIPHLRLHPKPLVLVDELSGQFEKLRHDMQKNDVAVIGRLETSKELIGYLLFGYKESGNVYSRQDAELIHIAADELAVAVQNALRFEEITRFNETLQDEVNVATAKLRESNKKLRALDEAKDEFISMASHQLRTPLTSVKGYVSMVLEGDAGKLSTDQRKLLEEAYASSQRMVYMIADFLNVSRLKTGKFLLEPSTINLADIVREEIEQLRPAAKSRALKLRTHLPADFPSLRLDETKIRQVIMNFIDNAIFYSRPGGEIDVRLASTPNSLTLTVTDTGIGVPNTEKQQLFTKFFRATNAMHVRPDGTGIGLFMAKKVVAAHGGEMIFESQEGQGSTFGFTLPLHPKTAGQSPQPPAKPE